MLYLVSLRSQKAILSLPNLYRSCTEQTGSSNIAPKKGKIAPAAAPPTFRPEATTGGGDPRSMVPVRLAGAEVSEGFCTKLAGLS